MESKNIYWYRKELEDVILPRSDGDLIKRYDIENIALSHNNLKILGHSGPILGHFRSFFLNFMFFFRFFRSAGRPGSLHALPLLLLKENPG